MDLTVYHLTGDMNDIDRFFRLNGGEICYHRNVWGKPRSDFNDSLSISFCRSEAKYRKTLPPKKFLADLELGTILSCPVCLTDAQIKVNWCYKRKQWSVTVITWKQLGKCRSPDDPQWKSMACWRTTGGDHRAQEHPPGAVRHRWSKGDDEVLGMEGYFIDPLWF
ncbi:uncharacterized protein CTRU02_200601 [Colletotrichum truncatum]|uniref:Uncharacterized protein n=1 Tax=Colletotrichum truncatum TaxID=5467 RepID=A0ACC3ZF08_COLTU|nr:uncharacterized protein CTRU02_00362 [Colletotrichum truncatum]KAF6801613.1 hypothetical protein CTRU02_00362 [Colletotrichum truncatum]